MQRQRKTRARENRLVSVNWKIVPPSQYKEADAPLNKVYRKAVQYMTDDLHGHKSRTTRSRWSMRKQR
jgi:hypothetical protein